MKKVLFLGTHGQKNWGDELLLDVFSNQLKQSADKLYVNSYDPIETQAFLKGKNAKVFNTQGDRLKLLLYLLTCDALVFGGGSIIKELYTAYGGAKYGTLQTLDTLTRVAKIFSKPIYFCNIGVGPIDSEKGRNLATGILNRGSSITVRDSESFKLLQSLPISVEYQLAGDAVFSIDREYLQLTAGPKARKNATIKTVGINLCRNISNNNNWDYFFEQLTLDLGAWLEKHPQAKLVGLPMQYDVENNNDYVALVELRKKISKLAPDIDFTILKPRSISEYAKAIENMDVIIAERLHTLILSIVIGTPIVALEYDIKVTGIIRDVGLGKFGLNINNRFNKGAILKLIDDVAADYVNTVAQVREAYTATHQLSAASFDQLKKALQK